MMRRENYVRHEAAISNVYALLSAATETPGDYLPVSYVLVRQATVHGDGVCLGSVQCAIVRHVH